jgi:hypothetical protein
MKHDNISYETLSIIKVIAMKKKHTPATMIRRRAPD